MDEKNQEMLEAASDMPGVSPEKDVEAAEDVGAGESGEGKPLLYRKPYLISVGLIICQVAAVGGFIIWMILASRGS